jgi:hypothetical protein
MRTNVNKRNGLSASVLRRLRERKLLSYSCLCFLAFAASAVVFLTPSPSSQFVATERRWFRTWTPDSLVVVGNSVVDHVSRCDADRRTIPEMLRDVGRRPVIDMSYGGQNLEESLGYAWQAVNKGGRGPLVFFVSSFAFNFAAAQDLRSELLLRGAGGALRGPSLLARFAEGVYIAPRPPVTLSSYTYRGKTYPTYEAIKETYFSRERQHMGCPETLGIDSTFIESNYWNNYARSERQAIYVDEFEWLARATSLERRPFLVVLLPVDGEDLSHLNPELAQQIRQRADDVSRALRVRHVPLLDMSAAESADRFADRWCACGHLGETGREDVVRRALASLPPAEDADRAVQ